VWVGCGWGVGVSRCVFLVCMYIYVCMYACAHEMMMFDGFETVSCVRECGWRCGLGVGVMWV